MSPVENLALDNTFVRELTGLYEPWQAAPVPEPDLLVLNEELADELGLAPEHLVGPEGVAFLTGNELPDGATPVAQAYAGHQFGGYSPLLGDGRALLVGEVIDTAGRRRDLHLKGSGPTPFARRGDGWAAVGPMLREYLMGEAMHALGIATTRALAVVATGRPVRRERDLPGAVLVRVASSHLRVGTFQYAAAKGDTELLRRLADYAIARHHPELADAEHPYLALLDAVCTAQARLVAQWMQVGFIHGVMNTDNVTISAETIDYGPCAFMDAFDPATVFSSIDDGGRYAFGQQPGITRWNLARFAESLLSLIDEDDGAAIEAATAVLDGFATKFNEAYGGGLRHKLGLDRESTDSEQADELVNDFLALLHRHQIDMTAAFRALSSVVRGDDVTLWILFGESESPEATAELGAWVDRWSEALPADQDERDALAARMDSVNPIYIPRNHLVEEALDAATAGDMAPFSSMLDVLRDPFRARPGLQRYADPPPAEFAHQTFCGT